MLACLTDFVRFSLENKNMAVSKTLQILFKKKTLQQCSTHKLDPDEIHEAMTPSQEIPETNDNFQENRGVMMSLSVQNSRVYRVTFPRAVRSVI
jgi:hypothetical protein